MRAFGFLLMILGIAIIYWAVTPGTKSIITGSSGPFKQPTFLGFDISSVLKSPSWQEGAKAKANSTGGYMGYVAGQCTAFVAAALSWVPAGWGDAKDWLANAQKQGFTISNTPVLGSIAVWGAGRSGASNFGHVGIVTGNTDTQVDVLSMNGNNNPFNIASATVPINSPTAYILPPGF